MAESPSIDSAARDSAQAARPEASAEPNAALAWRILSSPTTLLALCALLALVLAIAASLPQRPLPAELARRMSFASADAAGGLGLVDVLGAWPALLLLLLIALNTAGIAVARAYERAAPAASPSAAGASDALWVARATWLAHATVDEVRARLAALRVRVPPGRRHGRRGVVREGAALAALGAAALLIGLVIARGDALDARMTQVPGSGALADGAVRDGDLFLARRLAYGLVCGRPDPQDPHRAFGCALAKDGEDTPRDLSLAPGYTTTLDGLALSPLAEEPRRFSDDEPYQLVLRRAAVDGRERIEGLRLEPGQSVVLSASGEKLTAFAGPSGPWIVVEAGDDAPPLVLRPAPLMPEPTALASGLTLEVEPATRLVIAVTTAPESPLVLAGVVLFVLGLLAMALVPHAEVVLETVPGGTRVVVRSTNRPALPQALVAHLARLPDAPRSAPPVSLTKAAP